MSNEILGLSQQGIRGTDSNSLLRLYDLASEIVTGSPSHQERVKAGKAAERIAKELHRRQVRL